MPVTSKFKLQRIAERIKKAKQLKERGHSIREIGVIMGKSHTWVWLALNDGLPSVDNFELDPDL